MLLRVATILAIYFAFMTMIYFWLKKQDERKASKFAFIGGVFGLALLFFAVWLVLGGGDMLSAQSWQQAICDLPSTDC